MVTTTKVAAEPPCGTCGLPIPADAPAGLCPRCLLRRAKAGGRQSFPRDLGKYRLLEVVGQGGMGIVYRAYDTSADRLVALKTLRERELASEEEARRFQNEARRASSLQHERIVRVLDVGEHEGCAFFTMELVDGETLAEEAPALADDPRRAAEMVRKLADGVHFAHQHMILHRDLKPANVLLKGHDEPCLVDFGIARRLGAPSETQTGDIVGTRDYMAPEQRAGDRELTTAVDVYGLGAILYELLTGAPPGIDDKARPAPRAVNPHVDADLDTICRRCLEASPADRYASAADVAEDLQRYLDGKVVLARPIGAWERALRSLRMNPIPVAVAGAVLLLLVTTTSVAVSVARAQERELEADVLKTNAFAARALSGAVLFALSGLAHDVETLAADPLAKAALRAGEGAPAALERWRDAVDLKSFSSVILLEKDGTWLTRSPRASPDFASRNFAWRDHFLGAAHLGAAGRRGVYVSRSYQSKVSDKLRFSISAPVYDDDGAFLGVLEGAVETAEALGPLVIADAADDARTAVLIARGDRETPQEPLPSVWFVIIHEDVAPGSRHTVPNRPALERLAARIDACSEADPPPSCRGPPIKLADADAFSSDDDHRDSVPGFEGRWLAGIAPVGETPFAVVVETRYEAALEANERLGNRLLVAGVASLVAAMVAAAALSLWGRRFRRRRARPA